MRSLHRINLFLCCTVCRTHQQDRHKKVKVEKDIHCDLTIIFVTLTFLNVFSRCLFVTGDLVTFCNSKIQLTNAKWEVSPWTEVLFCNYSAVII
jgi:hypothetical protein